MSTRQDTIEDRLANVEEKLSSLQDQLDILPDVVAARIQAQVIQTHSNLVVIITLFQQEKIDQKRNFLHPESAASLQQTRSVPATCLWPSSVPISSTGRPPLTTTAVS